jgi:DHA2 family multidrug resistance protein
MDAAKGGSPQAAVNMGGMPAPPKPGTVAYRRLNIGFFSMVIGMFMAILDIQIVASSIQKIQAGVSASADEISWIQTSYLIAEVIGIPLSGLLNRAIGMKRLWVYSAAGFTLASALCAMAWNLESLVFFRCIQGFLGAAMIPTTMAAAFTLFGPNRSMVQQVMIGMVATLAPSIGPTLGGWLTDNFSWHWLFLVNVIPGIIACFLVWEYIPQSPRNLKVIKSIDFIGLGAMGLFLGTFEWIFEEGPKAGWFQDENLVIWMTVCAAAGAFFFWRAFTQKNPAVDLTIFKDRNFSVGALVATVVGFGLFGSVFLTPLFLGQIRGFSAIEIGQIMSVGGLAMFVAGPIAGMLIRKIDPRIVMVIGLILAATGLYFNANLTSQSGFDELFWPQALRGAGLIMCMVPSNFLALGTLPPMKLPNATGLVTVCRNLGGAVGLAALNTMRLTYDNLHKQEVGAGMSPLEPGVAQYIAQQEARLQTMGSLDPHGQAVASLGRRAIMEASVITFNNLFLVMSCCFVAMLLLVPLIRKPPPMGASAAPRPEAH